MQPAPLGLQQQSDAGASSIVVHAPFVIVALHHINWQSPASSRLKCNIDTTFSTPHNRTSVGICLRDDEGIFVLAKIVSFAGVYFAEVGETLGLFHTIQWLSDMKMNNIDFEVDSKITKDAFTSRREDIFEFGHIVVCSFSLYFSFQIFQLSGGVC